MFVNLHCNVDVVFSSQVRAAAVFALGTYIMNIPEDGQSDLSISIDHSVGMRLLTLVNDGSPIVRRVILVKILLFKILCWDLNVDI